MEAIILAGGKAERLGGGAARAVVAGGAGQEETFEPELSGLGAEIVAVGEPEPLGRGGGIRFAASFRREDGPVYALNGDELLAVYPSGLPDRHRSPGAAAPT